MTITTPQTASQDHGRCDTHADSVLAGPKQVQGDQPTGGIHSTIVVPHPQTPDQAIAVATPRHCPPGRAHSSPVTMLGATPKSRALPGTPTPTVGHATAVTHFDHADSGPTTPDQAKRQATPNAASSGRAQTPTTGHGHNDTQSGSADGGSQTPDQTSSRATTKDSSSGRAQTSPTANQGATPKSPPSSATQTLTADHEASGHQAVTVGGGHGAPEQAIARPQPIDVAPVLVSRELAVLAERVHALEEFRKACANQHRALTDTKPHKDGKRRGQHLPADHPVAISSAGIVGDIKVIEDQFVKLLAKEVKRSPLGPWIKSQHGLGEKTIARLLGAIGDPYWNDLHGRPRTVSELWSFCGYRPGTRRAKGDQLRYSPDAKMRAHVVIEPIIKLITKPCYSVKGDKDEYLYAVHSEDECTCSPYRVIYDQARDKYRDTLHPEDCSRCAPKGHPAKAGSPRSAKHQHAMACRVVKKAILKELWREAKRLHELPGDHTGRDTHGTVVAGAPS